jgi:hypothetical protein
MAHDRAKPWEASLYYCGTSIGQLLLHDENLLDYLKLTAPFGSGDEKVDAQGKPSPSTRPSRTKTPTKEGAQRLASAIARGWGKRAGRMRELGTLDRSKLDDHFGPKDAQRLRILIGDLEKG